LNVSSANASDVDDTASTQCGCGVVVLLRHGESTTNAARIFTGLLDAELTSTGQELATSAGLRLSALGLIADAIYSSTLRRAEHTAQLTLAAMTSSAAPHPPIRPYAVFAERHYGALTGRNKNDVAECVGDALLSEWRNSATTRPPPIDDADLLRLRRRGWPLTQLESRDVRSESLNDVRDRTRPFVRERLLPHLSRGDRVLVVAHGNSLRAIAAELAGLDATQLSALRIPTGDMILCQVGADGMSLSRPSRW
jgi:2,3-bisphosphoglycerate-dependent phosphoglycerate mutase